MKVIRPSFDDYAVEAAFCLGATLMACNTENSKQLEKILRLSEVENYVGLKRSTIYRMVNSGGFPKQIKLTPRCVGWRCTEIQHWISQREVASGKISQ